MIDNPLSIRAQLQKIIESRHFKRAERLTRLLTFLVESAIAGVAQPIKEEMIAHGVFDRGAKLFDPYVDSIVRVTAQKARARLQAYYSAEGRDDLVIIDIPAGHYYPDFRKRLSASIHGVPRDKAQLRNQWNGIRRGDDQIIGRESELSYLHSNLALMGSGRGKLICLKAEPGYGKTALAEHFVRSVADSMGWLTGVCGCYMELQDGEPFFAWRNLVSDLVLKSGLAAELVTEVAPAWWNLSRSTSTSSIAFRDVSPRREMAGFIKELAKHSPLLLFFDDLHWADLATIDLLHYVSSLLSSLPVLIVVAYRPSDMAGQNNVFHRIAQELKMRGLCEDLTLERLDRAATLSYIDYRLKTHRLSSTARNWILERSGGHPLCLVSIIGHCIKEGWIALENSVWTAQSEPEEWGPSLPQSISALIEKKIGTPTEGERHLLDAAAVQDEPG